jgi:hypothetical protein
VNYFRMKMRVVQFDGPLNRPDGGNISEKRKPEAADLGDPCHPAQGRVMICVGDTPWTRRTHRVKWL